MLLMAVVPGVTFVLLAGSPAGWFAGSEVPRTVFTAASGETHQQSVITTALPYVVATWLLGVVLLLVRLTGGWCQVQRVKREMLRNSDGGWQETVDRLSRRLKLRSVVRIVESAAASVPTVIGWIRPIILMPAAAACGLSPQQLEVVIAHELAHIRRHDYLVNLLQSVMETLLFYHPGVWWVSGRMREEREYCCDDMAVAVCGDPIRYARVLTDLETLRGTTLHLGLSSTGGSLMNRVTRLVGLSAARPRRGSLWILTAFAMTAAAGVASVAGHSLIGASDDADAPKTVMVKLDLQTVGEEGEGHFVWVTPTSDTSEVEAQGVWVMNETVDGESHGVWVTTQTVEGEATVQTKAVTRWMLTSRADETVVEFVDEEEESGGLSLLTLVYRYLSRVVADDRGDKQNNTFIGHLERQHVDYTAQFGEATGHFTFEVEDGEYRVPHLKRVYTEFVALQFERPQINIDIEIEPTAEAGQLIEVRPVITEDRKRVRLELHVEMLHEVDEDGETPPTVMLQRRGMIGTLSPDHGDSEGAERLHRVYLNVVKPTAEIHFGVGRQAVSAKLSYARTVFEPFFGPLTEVRAQYHVLRGIYIDVKEGEEAEVKVLIEFEVDESGDQ